MGFIYDRFYYHPLNDDDSWKLEPLIQLMDEQDMRELEDDE